MGKMRLLSLWCATSGRRVMVALLQFYFHCLMFIVVVVVVIVAVVVVKSSQVKSMDLIGYKYPTTSERRDSEAFPNYYLYYYYYYDYSRCCGCWYFGG